MPLDVQYINTLTRRLNLLKTILWLNLLKTIFWINLLKTILWKNILFLYCASIWGIIAFFPHTDSITWCEQESSAARGEVSFCDAGFHFRVPFYVSHHLLRPHGTMQGKARRAVVPFCNPL